MSDRIRINLSMYPEEVEHLREMAGRGGFTLTTFVATLCRHAIATSLGMQLPPPSNHARASVDGSVADEITDMFTSLSEWESNADNHQYL